MGNTIDGSAKKSLETTQSPSPNEGDVKSKASKKSNTKSKIDSFDKGIMPPPQEWIIVQNDPWWLRDPMVFDPNRPRIRPDQKI